MIKRGDNIVQKRDIWKYAILSLGMLAVLSGCGNKNGLPETSTAEVEVKNDGGRSGKWIRHNGNGR